MMMSADEQATADEILPTLFNLAVYGDQRTFKRWADGLSVPPGLALFGTAGQVEQETLHMHTHTLVIPVLSEHLQSEYISQPLQNNVSEPCVQSRAISLDIVQYSGVLGESPGQTRSFSCKHIHGVHYTSSSTTSLQSTMRTLDSCSASTHTDGHACTITWWRGHGDTHPVASWPKGTRFSPVLKLYLCSIAPSADRPDVEGSKRNSGCSWEFFYEAPWRTHLTSSPTCPIDRPIHQSVGPSDNWINTRKNQILNRLERPHLIGSHCRTSFFHFIPLPTLKTILVS